MATGWLKDATPTLPLALQTHLSERSRRALTGRHCDKPAFGIRHKEPAIWGKAKSDFLKASLLGWS